jgi:hypothetical protein
MHRSFQRPGFASLAAFLAFAASEAAEAAVVNWVGGTSFWDIATNWGSNPLLPGSG